MNLDEARKIASSVPNVVFEVEVSNHGLGMATEMSISGIESLAERLPVVSSPMPNTEYIFIRSAKVSKDVLQC